MLVRYSGWGAYPWVFDEHPFKPQPLADELRALVTEAEWEGLRASTPNAHYTSPLVIEALWHAVQHLGLRGTVRVLEPALGVGHFFGLQPEALAGPRTGIELESLSARIAAQLYPDSNVHAGAFEAQPRLGGYDLVIGNVPFGNYGVVDPHYGRHSVVTRSIHDYFIGRALDELRPGGLAALITSRFTLDKVNDGFRVWAGERASLLGALRLPRTTFKANAGTEVVTDVLLLQRHFEGGPSGVPWRSSCTASSGEPQEEPINEYFREHPEQVLGTFAWTRGLYGRSELTVKGALTADGRLEALYIQSVCASIQRSTGRKVKDGIDFTALFL